MSESVSLPPDASARLAMLSEMLKRSSPSSEGDSRSDVVRRESSRSDATTRKGK
jgi:hypothetical protein